MAHFEEKLSGRWSSPTLDHLHFASMVSKSSLARASSDDSKVFIIWRGIYGLRLKNFSLLLVFKSCDNDLAIKYSNIFGPKIWNIGKIGRWLTMNQVVNGL